MAGVMMAGDEGREVMKSSVPTNSSESGTAEVAGNPRNDHRANGVAYPETAQVSLDGGAYPSGTDFGEASNPLKP